MFCYPDKILWMVDSCVEVVTCGVAARWLTPNNAYIRRTSAHWTTCAWWPPSPCCSYGKKANIRCVHIQCHFRFVWWLFIFWGQNMARATYQVKNWQCWIATWASWCLSPIHVPQTWLECLLSGRNRFLSSVLGRRRRQRVGVLCKQGVCGLPGQRGVMVPLHSSYACGSPPFDIYKTCAKTCWMWNRWLTRFGPLAPKSNDIP